MRCAVVGHNEWTEFVLVEALPGAGEIAHGSEAWVGPAGGGSVMAVQLARLAGECDYFTVFGEDDLGRRAASELADRGVTVHPQWFGSTRRAFTQVEPSGERTITTMGPKLRPRGPLPLEGYDAVFFVAGEPDALRSARAGRFLAATPREVPTLVEGGVHLDLLVGSGTDPGERYDGGLDVELVVRTEGARGGTVDGRDRRYEAVPLPSRAIDAYGAGDTFGATLCFALARGDELDDALAFAASEAAAVVCVRGPYRE